ETLAAEIPPGKVLGEREGIDWHAPHRLPVADPAPGLFGFRDGDRPHRPAARPHPAPHSGAGRKPSKEAAEAPEVRHRIGERSRNAALPEQNAPLVLVLAH